MRKVVCPAPVFLAFAITALGQNYTIQTFAGGGVPQNIQAASASLGRVTGIAADSSGNVYIALQSYSVVVRMDVTGALTLVAGIGKPGFSGDNGAAANAQLNSPWGLAIDTAGNLYIADSGNNRIRKDSAFTLGVDQFPATAGIRGTIEFDAPAGAQIGALGIRIPIAHTFTTLPVLTK